MVKVLLAEGAEINHKGETGQTPLSVASDQAMALLLREAGAQ
jgi:hypothetical protein